ARYEFLKLWQKMESDLGMTIPKGAGALVDAAFRGSIDRNGREKTLKYVKRFFRNVEKN
ncbi:MAG TPA: ribonuclease HIII, partial [Firmicutes bacterium]|nr:ribonuclease HIII [Bacillota bacterium]